METILKVVDRNTMDRIESVVEQALEAPVDGLESPYFLYKEGLCVAIKLNIKHELIKVIFPVLSGEDLRLLNLDVIMTTNRDYTNKEFEKEMFIKHGTNKQGAH